MRVWLLVSYCPLASQHYAAAAELISSGSNCARLPEAVGLTAALVLYARAASSAPELRPLHEPNTAQRNAEGKKRTP